MRLGENRGARRATAMVAGLMLVGGCSLTPWGDDADEELPAWAGKAPRQAEVQRDVGLTTNQKSLEPEEAARLDQLSDAESIQKNVAIERVEGADPCMGAEAVSARCSREIGGRGAAAAGSILPEVSLQMVAPETGRAFDPARAVDGIGRGAERRSQEFLAVGDNYLNPAEAPEEDAPPDDLQLPEGILVDPSVVGASGQ